MRYTIIALVTAIILVLLLSFTRKHRSKKKEAAVLNYIKENPEKSSIFLVRDGKVLADLNSDKLMPLASTVKIIIAVEYAEQAASGLLNPDEIVSFDQLDQFYIPGTDGGAHMAWFKSIKGSIVDDGIPLREVAKGMILYSSNANTEWLCERLGLENINQRIKELGIEKHSEIYNIVSALFVGKELFPDLKEMDLVNALEALPMSEYLQATKEIHAKLMTDVEYKKTVTELNFGVQKVWSDRLPASSTAEYGGLMQKLNSRTYFSTQVHEYLSEVLEVMMENPANQKWLEHSGTKGGSTAFVLTKALYATTREGHTTELAYFFNDVGFLENGKLQRSMNQFEIKILTDPTFIDEVSSTLAELK